MLIQSYVLLCALAVLTCMATLTRWQQLGWGLAGLVTALVLFNPLGLALPFTPLLAEPSQIALLLVVLAFMRVVYSVPVPLLLFGAGVLACLWLQGLLALAYPLPLALLLVAGSCVATLAGCLYRTGFRSIALLHEAFLLLGAGGLAVTLLPDLLKGWNSAMELHETAGEGVQTGTGTEALWLALVFVVLGVARALWSSRDNRRSR